MPNNHSMRILRALAVLVFAALACSGGAPPEPTEPPPTETPLPEPTATRKPTSTPKPTQTPNVAETQKVGNFYEVMAAFEEQGYIEASQGDIFELDSFEEEWAQIGWYSWWEYDDPIADFLISSHFEWSTASATPEVSGCGFVFGIQDNGDHYSVFLDKSRILFLMKRGSSNYLVGKTRGSGRANFGNPAEADFALAVKGQSAYVSVNGEFTEYTLSVDQSTSGRYGQTLLSGTNADYGTRCVMTDVLMWTP